MLGEWRYPNRETVFTRRPLNRRILAQLYGAGLATIAPAVMTHQQRPTGISIGRLVAAHVLILGIVGSSVYDIATEQEHFPFSNYPMFSTVHRTPTLRWYRLFGVTTDGREVALLKYSQLWPLDQSRLPLGLRRIHQEPGHETRLKEALSDILQRYERRRAAGEHDGPPVCGLRLYEIGWDLEPYAANLERPGSRELIAEVGDFHGSP